MSENPIAAPETSTTIEWSELPILRAILEGTVQATGENFLQLLIQNLCIATGAANGFIAEFTENRVRVKTLAFWMNGELIANQEWDLEGTPCEEVLTGKFCHYPTDLWKLFPKEEGFESYLGVPLLATEGAILGHLAVFDTLPMPESPRLLYSFKIFAARAAAELNRLQVETQLRQSEQRYRDLFDEAPIAYVHEDVQSRFLDANRAAIRILGITPDQVPGMLGASFIPDTPDAKRRLQEAFASAEKGTESAGVILELRRKDNGKPVWIRWWSKLDRSGQFMRTLFIDITAQVLMEQEQAKLHAQNLYLQEEIKSSHNFEEIIGHTDALQSLLDQVQRVAQTDASVLIQGESGTGKELIARAIHSASKRNMHPMIKVNCAALPSGLIESELFGHEKGAFTGATSQRIGRLELAEGGTLFLDEVGEIPMDVQVKLLRVLQEREFERVGGQKPIRMDVRIISATNRNLLDEVSKKNFREDLFYRLNVFPLTTPPLRDRLEDIPLLVKFLIEKFAPKIGKKIIGISAQSMERLQAYHWPGNIRELENIIERAIILTDHPLVEIDLTQLPRSEDNSAVKFNKTEDSSMDTVAKEHILTVLEQARWIIEGPHGAAKMLNLKPSTLRYRMQKLGIKKNN